MKKLVLGLAILGSVAFAGYIGSGGVQNVREADRLSGVQFYKVTCNSGASKIVGQRNGYWIDYSFNEMGDQFKNLSLNEFAEKACR